MHNLLFTGTITFITLISFGCKKESITLPNDTAITMNKSSGNSQAKGALYPKETNIYKGVRIAIFYSTAEQKQMFKEHGRNFGIKGSWSNEEANKFKRAVIAHVQAKDTSPIEGSYKKEPAIHYYNKKTMLDVIISTKGCRGCIKTIRKGPLQSNI